MASTLITVAEARKLVLKAVQPLPAERVAVLDALGRVLAEDVLAAGDVPPFACSAMDGYAVRAGESGRTLAIIDESRAGAPAERELRDGEAIRISTGAAVPAGADAVIPQEDVRRRDELVETNAPVRPWQNVRGPGEDMRAGATVLKAGTRLDAVALGAAVSAGLGTLTVTQRPRVVILCTGDELREPGEPLGPGQIHNSNAPMLTGLAARQGGEATPTPPLRDDRAASKAGIAEALANSELVIVSGGVSVGPHDHVKPVLAELGVEQRFWGVALQPGKPTWFGTLDRGPVVFGLPGNPVSAVVTFSLFVAPALTAMQGERMVRRLEPSAVLTEDVRRNPRREQAIRVRLQRGGGPPTATPNGPQGSHILTSLIGADALAMIPAAPGELPAGSTVELEALST